MIRRISPRLVVCFAFLALLGLEARADPIEMTFTGDSGISRQVDYTDVLPDGTLGAPDRPWGTYPPGMGTVGAPTGFNQSINSPIALALKLKDTAAPDSQGLTLSLSGRLIGSQYTIHDGFGNPRPGVEGKGTINSITVTGLDPATNQTVSSTIEGPNGTLGAAELARFASIGHIPEPLLATLTTPSQYSSNLLMYGAAPPYSTDFYIEELEITPLTTAPPISAPEPTPLAVLGLAALACLLKRARAARIRSTSQS